MSADRPSSSLQTPREQPTWQKPAGKPTGVKVFNSLTRQKDELVQRESNGNDEPVTWYCCGPTVYDSSHMGHARAYITFDILRRIMTSYFNIPILYVMNITDIDDKIILGARYKHLFEKFASESHDMPLEKVKDVCLKAVVGWWLDKCSKGIPVELNANNAQNAPTGSSEPLKNLQEWLQRIQTNESFKAETQSKIGEKFSMYITSLTTALTSLTTTTSTKQSLLTACRDQVSHHLDTLHGHELSDPTIFRAFAAYWESEFFKDMQALNVLKPDVVTRVSEFVDEIVEYVQKIAENGYAYLTPTSVYFDTTAFQNSFAKDGTKHYYCKLEPWSRNDEKLIAEGEGALSSSTPITSSTTTTNTSKVNIPTRPDKSSKSDFALWKLSRPGEPAYPSPWGPGRPGWHIECSTMAYHVLGEKMDIHSGGVDLKFPHHDNECAQAEAHSNSSQWVNYFLHAGHLHIEGSKMSKSLKNFITIREALKTHKASTIRVMFLLSQWDSTLDYKEDSLRRAKELENTIHSFLTVARSLIAESALLDGKGDHNLRQPEMELLSFISSTQSTVHKALCDNFNTPGAMTAISELITKANVYIAAKNRDKTQRVNPDILGRVVKYIEKMMNVFGVFGDSKSDSAVGEKEQVLLPYLQILSQFRDSVRELSRTKAPYSSILQACDALRDEQLLPLGVMLDDREDGTALVKFVDPEEIAKQREEKKAQEEEKLRKKEAERRKKADARVEKLKKGVVRPEDMFKNDEFSQWDENGIPTQLANGEEVPKSKKKKLQKEYDVQVKLHEEWKAFVAKGGQLDVEWVLKNE